MICISDAEEMVAESMSLLMDRSSQLNKGDQEAIGQEFREWFNDGFRPEDLLTFRAVDHI